MLDSPQPPAGFDTWLQALEARHLANLTRAELTRALRALSSCYVERRGRLGDGAALEGAGKRAAFALFYAPLHFLTIDRVVRALGANATSLRTIVDLGCGTGAASAAWACAIENPPAIAAIDRSGWAAQEANWTYQQFALRGRATVGDVTSTPLRGGRDTGIILAYTVNELTSAKRAAMLDRLVDRMRAGSCALIVEPIARRTAAWWPEWSDRIIAEGGRADEWRVAADLPRLLRDIAKGAGLDSRTLTARSLFVASQG